MLRETCFLVGVVCWLICDVGSWFVESDGESWEVMMLGLARFFFLRRGILGAYLIW